MKPIRDRLADDPLPGRFYGTVEGEAFTFMLADKLHEEADEVKSALAIGGEVLIEEIADIVEIALAIAERRGVSEHEVYAVRKRKFRQRGAFYEGRVIV